MQLVGIRRLHASKSFEKIKIQISLLDSLLMCSEATQMKVGRLRLNEQMACASADEGRVMCNEQSCQSMMEITFVQSAEGKDLNCSKSP